MQNTRIKNKKEEYVESMFKFIKKRRCETRS